MPTRLIAQLTWQEFRDNLNDNTIVIVPVGSIELEGLHLPLGVDTIVAQSLALALSDIPEVLIGPTLPIGYSKWFMPFPGTISLELDTLIHVLYEYASSLISHGVRRLVFLNAHRGNNGAIESVAHKLISERKIHVAMLNIWKLANDLSIQKNCHIQERRFTHAGEIMTSLMLALDSEKVAVDKMVADQVKSPEGSAFKIINSLGETEFKGSVQTVFQDIRQITNSGTMGDPSKASLEKGKALLNEMITYICAFIEEFRKLN